MSNFADLLICDALIYDGSAAPPFLGELAVKDDKILALGAPGSLPRQGIKETYSAEGAILSPGFIDVHSHSDVPVLKVPSGDSKISQGVTTEIVGNCGSSEFVYSKEKNALGDAALEGCDGSFEGYCRRVEAARPALNIAALCGHNSLRVRVMGYEDRQASQSELAAMKSLLQEALQQGAAGFSSGLWYIPGRFADSAELKELATVLRGSGKPYCTHMRNEGDTLLESLAEAIEIAKSGDGILQVSHFKTSQQRNWNKLDAALGMVEKARAEGMQIFADRYPYTYSSTSLRMVVPPPYNKIDSGSLTKLLQESAQEREKLAKLLETGNGERDNWDKIILVISSAPEHAKLYGKNMLQIAEQLGMSAAQACVKLLSEASPSAAFGSMSEENLKGFLAQPWVLAGSDGSIFAFTDGRTHPRAFGSFPRFFQLARQQASIESVIQRMSALSARQFRLCGRGRLVPGYFADLVIFEPDNYLSAADYGKSNVACTGVRRVYVNGALAYSPDKTLPLERRGRMLRVSNKS
ncbi:MAG: amidohydrolase family protein [Lentisphaeria bacterium]|jgi:N-acyl-D-amino-acid deacylase|nr:amidohydrolase family protein [Lentisphaeria bacterium]MDY0177272.1 amidohydrolase family protein [Lentisphaeria bacterium]NLZ60296.1 amidohydrolase family protein [Lentisphaerota bacterium]